MPENLQLQLGRTVQTLNSIIRKLPLAASAQTRERERDGDMIK